MDRLYSRFGCYENRLQSLALPGAGGMERMGRIMAALRAAPPRALGGETVKRITDYRTGAEGLPPRDVLAFSTSHGRVTVRPSGTEPKLKLYFSARGGCMDDARRLCAALWGDMAVYVT